MLDKYSWGDFTVAMASLYLIYYIWYFYKYILPGLGNKSLSNNNPGRDAENTEFDDDEGDLHANEFINNSNKRLHDIENFNNIVKDKESAIPQLDFDEGYYEEEEISAEEIMENVHFQKILEDGNNQEEANEPIFKNFSDDSEVLDGDHQNLQKNPDAEEIEEKQFTPGLLDVPQIVDEIEELEKVIDDNQKLGEGDGQSFNFDIYMENDPEDIKITEANVINPEKSKTKDSVNDDENNEGFNFDKYI